MGDRHEPLITIEQFRTVEIRVGTVMSAAQNPKARKPSYVLTIDFGPELGCKSSSAQIVDHYRPEDLIGTQVVAVVNFLPKLIAGMKSEVLVLASVGPDGTVLLSTTRRVAAGSRIA